MEKTFKKEEMATMSECMNKLYSEGYKENFIAKEHGLEAQSSKKIYHSSDVKIANFYRFEGESDPADNSILYAIETSDGVKGMVADAYGPNSNQSLTKFIKEVEEMTKKNPV